MRLAHGSQLTLELQPGLLRRYSTIREAVHHSVLNDPRSLDVNLFDAIMTSTGDLTPLHWLNAKHLADAEAKKRAAIDAAARVLPELLQALSDAGFDMKRGGRR